MKFSHPATLLTFLTNVGVAHKSPAWCLVKILQPTSNIRLTGPGTLITGPFKPNVALKKPRMGDYMQNKVLDEGFNLVYVVTIFIGGNTN